MLKVLFTCEGCGLTKKRVEVRFRRADENLANWMEHVKVMVTRCHFANSPRCGAKKMADLYVPDHKIDGLGIGMDPAAPR